MNELINIIKIICIIQVVLIVLLVSSIFLYKIYRNYLNKYKNKFILNTEALLNDYIERRAEIKSADFKLFRYNLMSLLSIIKRFDALHQTNLHWQNIKTCLLRTLLLPKARQASTKRGWYKRYFATQVFQQMFEKQDISFITQLIDDSIPLVALNAAKIAAATNSDLMIKQLIQSFSGNRILQNALFIQAIEIQPPALSLVAQHLNHQKNVYSRVFCYQLLSNQFLVQPEIKQVHKDINSKNIDLQIAALTCYVSTSPKNLYSLLVEKIKDDRWEIRARVAKLMGSIKENFVYELLETALKDKNWWVRTNAAESLYQLGSEGIKILEKQKPEEDQFAYDVAARVLATAQMKDKR